MDILKTLIASASGGGLGQAAQSRGIDSAGAESLLKHLVPVLTGQMKRNASTDSGLSGLTQALANGNHDRYIDNPSALTANEAIDDGNGILGHLLGSKDASRNLAAHAAGKTGIDVDAIKKFLPIVAAAAMGAMSKGSKKESSGLGGLLGSFIDSDGDGIGVDDLLSMGRKFF